MSLTTRELLDELGRRYGNPSDFCLHIKETLREREIPQAELAAVCGYDPSNLSRWLNLRQVPSLTTMLTIDHALSLILRP